MFKTTDTIIQLVHDRFADKYWLRLGITPTSINFFIPKHLNKRLKSIDCRKHLLSNAPKRLITLLKKLAHKEIVAMWISRALRGGDDSENYRDLLNIL